MHRVRAADGLRDLARKAQRLFDLARKSEGDYVRQLTRIAKQLGLIVKGSMDPDEELNPEQAGAIERALRAYGLVLKPWARKAAQRMVLDVDRRDKRAWNQRAHQLGISLRKEIETGVTGAMMQSLMARQVELISSIPEDSAKRVHNLTLEGITQGRRAAGIAREIRKTDQVSRSKAILIARTEVARTASLLTQSRAQHIGCETYIWRTAHDADVRPSHKAMEGKVVRFDSPPTLSDGTTTHAGQIYNCRCYMEPVIPTRV